MKTTRRSFMATAAALPAVAVVGVPAPIAAAVEPPLPPLPSRPYRWWYSNFGDIYSEEFAHGEFIEAKPEQMRELGDMVTEAIERWVRKNNIKRTAWCFRDVRNPLNATAL